MFSKFIKITLALLFICCSSFAQTEQKPVLKVKFVNLWPTVKLEDFKIFFEILEDKYDIRLTNKEDYDIVIDSVFGVEKIKNQKAFKIFFTGEALPAKTNGYDLSLGFEYNSHIENYIRLPLYYIYFNKKIDTNFKRENCNLNHKYFACFLVSNGRSPEYYDGVEARDHLFHRLSLYKKIISGGNHKNNLGRVIPLNKTNEFLSQCKFTIAYENKTFPGYITEKLFQAYFAGSLPIYYSEPNAQNDINRNAIISAQDFPSEHELMNYIIEVDKDDKKYCKIWNTPLFIHEELNYKAIQNKIRPFLKRFFE